MHALINETPSVCLNIDVFLCHTDQKYRFNCERKKKTQSDDFTDTRQSGFCSFLYNHSNTHHEHNLCIYAYFIYKNIIYMNIQ